jgi:polyferredoxin
VKQRLRLLFLLVLLGSSLSSPARVFAQLPDPAAASGAADDPWGFEDEETVETWGDILRPQAVDIGITTALIGFALFSFNRRSRPLKYATLAFTLLYLGVVKSTMISVTDIFRVVDSVKAVAAIPGADLSLAAVGTAAASSFPDFKYSVAWYIFAGFTVVSTVIWGRLYCGRICAFGAFTHWMDATLPKALRRDPPAWLERRANYIKYGMLVAVVAVYVVTHETTIYRYVEPFWMFTREATPLLWTMLALLLLSTVVVRNLYCRFLCPVGAMLGIIARTTTVLPIKRWSECKTCKICERTCEWGAIRGPHIVKQECVRCDDCERLYADQKACVHHLLAAKQDRWAKQGIPLKVVT